MKKIVFVRHGESEWNKKNIFTGWVDVGLSEKGVNDAKAAGQLLKESGFHFDIAYTSVLKRAIKTLDIILEEMDLMWIDVYKTWRLNERHYGALQGLNKSDTAAKYGEQQVKIWRRSYSTLPPGLEMSDTRLPSNDIKYKNVEPSLLPKAESLKETVERVVPFWKDIIVPQLQNDKKIIVSAHGNSLRALVKYLDKVSEEEIVELNIPTAIPLIYEFDEELNVVKSYYMGEQERINAEIENVKKQGRK